MGFLVKLKNSDELRTLLSDLGFPGLAASFLPDEWTDKEPISSPSSYLKELKAADRGVRLFDYQEELVQLITAKMDQGGRYLVSLPTGAGKTRTALAAILKQLVVRPELRTVWIAPSIELIDQAASTFESLWRQSVDFDDCVVAVRTRKGEGASVWFQTPQFLAGPNREYQAFDLVVFDEAHQLGAPSFRKALGRVTDSNSTVLGLSATPGRANHEETEDLVDFFDGHLLVSTLLGTDPVKTLQERGVLSRLTFKSITRQKVAQRSRERLLVLLELCRRLITRGRRTLVFTESVLDAFALERILQAEGFAAAALDGNLPEAAREERLNMFESGAIQLVLNQRLLATGYDCPAVSDVVLGGQVGSPILFEQIVGRAARGPLTGGNAYSRIWQFDDHLTLHGLPQSYYRYKDYLWS